MLDADLFNPPCESVHTNRPQDSGRTPHPMTKIRLIIDPPATGPWNMAIDEVLAHSAAERGVNTLRFYSWDPPTLSLGYFQRATDRQTHMSSSTCAWVRRTSGGGAILHDRELTYSFATATPVSDRGESTQQYDLFHDSLLEVLTAWNVRARRCAKIEVQDDQPEPFLCFERRACGDVLLGDAKIGGSAQRRRRGAMSQHGSVLLKQSEFAPELPGILELTSVSIEYDDLVDRRSSALIQRLGGAVDSAEYTGEELEQAKSLVHNKFGAETWNAKR